MFDLVLDSLFQICSRFGSHAETWGTFIDKKCISILTYYCYFSIMHCWWIFCMHWIPGWPIVFDKMWSIHQNTPPKSLSKVCFSHRLQAAVLVMQDQLLFTEISKTSCTSTLYFKSAIKSDMLKKKRIFQVAPASGLRTLSTCWVSTGTGASTSICSDVMTLPIADWLFHLEGGISFYYCVLQLLPFIVIGVNRLDIHQNTVSQSEMHRICNVCSLPI